MDEIIRAVAFVKRGKNKEAVFRVLDCPMMPRDISLAVFGDKSENSFSIVSRALADLEREHLAECLNPEDRTGRMWRRTSKGNQVMAHLRKMLPEREIRAS